MRATRSHRPAQLTLEKSRHSFSLCWVGAGPTNFNLAPVAERSEPIRDTPHDDHGGHTGARGQPKADGDAPAWPPDAPAVVATSGNRLMDVRNGKPRTYVPKLFAID